MEILTYAPPSRSFWSSIRYSHAWWAMSVRAGFATIVLLLGLLFSAGVLFAGSFSPFYAVILAGIFFGAIVRIVRELRQRWTARVLFHIEAAVRTGIPLNDYLHVAAASEGRFVRGRLLAIAELIERGSPLAVALPSGAPELSAHESRLIYAGERNGRLPQMLARIAHSERQRQERQMGPGFIYRWYLPVAAIAILVASSFIVIFVWPKFERILRDFQIPMPWLSQFPRLFVTEWWWLGLVLLVAPAMVWAGMEVQQALAPTNPGLERRRWGAWLGWIPVLGTLNRNRGLADICWILSADVRAGLPLSESAREISSLPLDADLNCKADRWHDLLEQGVLPSEAARRAGMPDLFCSILKTPGDGIGLADSLDIAGDLFDARHGRERAMLGAIAVPMVLCALAVVVLLLALSLFLPMLAMIDHLIGDIGGAQ